MDLPPIDSPGTLSFWDWDLPTGTMTWTGRLAGQSAAETAAVTSSVDAWFARMHPDDVAGVRAALAPLQAGTAFRADLTYRLRADHEFLTVADHVFAIHDGGTPAKLIGVAKAVTDTIEDGIARSVEEQLLDSEHRFGTFVESLPQLAWETDANGWIFFYNRRWYEYTGTTPEQMEGWGWIRVHDPKDLARMLRVFRTALLTGRAWEDEFKLRRADGQFRWHLSRAIPFRDATGRIVRWFGTNTDIHDQKLALEERERLLHAEQRLRAEAQRAAREKDEFLAVVSHELRSPLNAVLGWAQILRNEAMDGAKRSHAVEKIETNARYLEQLISDLLDVSRIVTGKIAIDRTPVDVAAAVNAAVDTVKALADARRIVIEHRTPTEPALTTGSADRIRQIVTNLLSNAIKFSADGQTVRCETSVGDGGVAITVADEGEGIDPAFLPHLFEKFTQADGSLRRRHHGLGLGLAIARHLTELHGGTIEARSAGIGGGAVFTVRMPATTATEVAGSETTRSPVAAASLAGIKVLAVDDEVEARDVVASVLLSCGATVTTAGSVAEALHALNIEVPDVIVSDLAMPEVDGFGLLERLRTSPDPRLTTLPVIALTATATDDAKRQALERGFTRYVVKPLDRAALSNAIATVVSERTVAGGGTPQG